MAMLLLFFQFRSTGHELKGERSRVTQENRLTSEIMLVIITAYAVYPMPFSIFDSTFSASPQKGTSARVLARADRDGVARNGASAIIANMNEGESRTEWAAVGGASSVVILDLLLVILLVLVGTAAG
jgi:hypothetical protein